MTIQEILKITEHRPWGISNKNWSYYQEWNNALFLHWEVAYDDLVQFIPKELEIDLYNGKPWVSLVAFTMNKIRHKNFISFPPISNFDEINIRTYVKLNKKSGVYFLSIEGGKKISCKIAKGISELPYRYSKIDRSTSSYKAENKEFGDILKLTFDVENHIEEHPLDIWLTERYALFQDTDKKINEFEIHHLKWDLNNVQLDIEKLEYPRFEKLIDNLPNKVHYSKGVKVIAWEKKSNSKDVIK